MSTEAGSLGDQKHDSKSTPVPALEPEGFVQPSSYLRPPRPAAIELDPVERDQREAVSAIRNFLKARTCYDVLPLSFRLIILDTSLLIQKSLTILTQNGIVSAPLWDSSRDCFAGLLTTSDYINVVQYYWQKPELVDQIDKLRLKDLRELEKALGVIPIETVSANPMRSMFEACTSMVRSRARRIPLVDHDKETGRPEVVSVITQYRILKFIAVNNSETQNLRMTIKELGLGTTSNLATATMDTPVIDVTHMLINKNITSVPIVDDNGVVINVYEAHDVVILIKDGSYEGLTLPVGEAILRRDSEFAGFITCSIHDQLHNVFETIRRSRVHRFIMVDQNTKLVGILTLSDILQYLLIDGVAA